MSLESGKLECAIIGIGINVRNTQSSLPPELHPIVTSLEEAIPGCQVRRSELLAAVLYELEVLLPELSFRRFLPEYRDRSCLIGKTAEITMENGARKRWLWWKSQTTAALWYGIPMAMWKLSTPEKCISVPAI